MTAGSVAARVVLARAHLEVALREGSSPYLELHSRLDRHQRIVLPLGRPGRAELCWRGTPVRHLRLMTPADR